MYFEGIPSFCDLDTVVHPLLDTGAWGTMNGPFEG